MAHQARRRFGHGVSPGLRLLLSLMLLLAPLVGAAPWPAAEYERGNRSAAQVPCHAGGDPFAQLDAAAQADCPHCTGETAPTSCHCCGQTAPAGIDGRLAGFKAEWIGLSQAGAAPADPLPDSPPGRLFRPPIAAC